MKILIKLLLISILLNSCKFEFNNPYDEKSSYFNTILPISKFTSEIKNNLVILSWETGSNYDYFEIEKLNSNNQFLELIICKDSLTFSSNKKNYTYVDNNSKLGDSYTYNIKGIMNNKNTEKIKTQISLPNSSIYENLKNGLLISYKFNGNFSNTASKEYNGTNNNIVFSPDRFNNLNSSILLNGVNSSVKTTFPGILMVANRSFSFWIKFLSSTRFPRNQTTVISYGNLDKWGGGMNIGFQTINNNPYVIFDNIGSAVGANLQDYRVVDGKWHNFTFVGFNKNLNVTNIDIYCDGRLLIKDWNYNPTNIYTEFKNNLLIGQYYPEKGDPRTFDGFVDDIFIWNRVLTIEEIGFLNSSNFNP